MAAEPFRVYPNPISSVLNITSESQTPIRQIRVFGLSGQEVLNAGNPESRGTLTVNTSAWDRGIYLVTVSDGINAYSYKIFK